MTDLHGKALVNNREQLVPPHCCVRSSRRPVRTRTGPDGAHMRAIPGVCSTFARAPAVPLASFRHDDRCVLADFCQERSGPEGVHRRCRFDNGTRRINSKNRRPLVPQGPFSSGEKPRLRLGIVVDGVSVRRPRRTLHYITNGGRGWRCRVAVAAGGHLKSSKRI